jgi:hypothetical protein
MYYESGYFTLLSWILGIGTVIAVFFVGLIYIKKHDIRFLWFWMAAMSLIAAVPAFIVLVRPSISQGFNAMRSEENTLRLYWFGLWFIITNVLWIIGVFAVSKEKAKK